MGKRTGQIAGLAALGALGYMLSKDKKGGPAPVESRARSSDTPAITSVASKSEEDSYPDESRRGRMTSPPESIAASVRTARVATPVAPRDAGAGRGGQGGPTAEQLEAYRASQAASRANNGQTSAPGDVPGAFAAVDRYHKETTGGTAPYAQGRYPMTKPQPTENTYSRQMGAEAGEAEAYKSAMDRFKKETAGMSPAVAQGRAPLTKRQPTANTYTRAMGAQAGEAEAYRAAKAREEAERRGLGVMKKGGAVKKMASGGMTSGASKRGDGIAQRGKTRGKIC